MLSDREMKILFNVKKALREFDEEFTLDDEIFDCVEDILNYIDNELA